MSVKKKKTLIDQTAIEITLGELFHATYPDRTLDGKTVITITTLSGNVRITGEHSEGVRMIAERISIEETEQ